MEDKEQGRRSQTTTPELTEEDGGICQNCIHLCSKIFRYIWYYSLVAGTGNFLLSSTSESIVLVRSSSKWLYSGDLTGSFRGDLFPINNICIDTRCEDKDRIISNIHNWSFTGVQFKDDKREFPEDWFSSGVTLSPESCSALIKYWQVPHRSFVSPTEVSSTV